MANKKRICKSCGYYTDSEVCPYCQGKVFLDKYKSLVIILNPKKSKVAEYLQIKNKGIFGIRN